MKIKEMNNIQIGVVGQGFVGGAVMQKFREDFNVYTYDKYNEDASRLYLDNEKYSKDTIDLTKVVKYSDFIFACVPTPMYEDGECDTRIVESVIEDIHNECVSLEKNTVVVCKSTMPPGTTERLNEISPLVTVLFSPEFLTEANAVEDFNKQTRIILGVPSPVIRDSSTEITELVKDAFRVSFPDAQILTLPSGEAEMVKYMTNLFLATKVSFFNDMANLCSTLNLNYDNVIMGTLLDKRIGNSHTAVPGPDGDRGFGGHCFPKDLSAMLFMSDKLGLRMPTLDGAQKTNKMVRRDLDWERMEGRAVSKRDNKDILEFDQYGQKVQ